MNADYPDRIAALHHELGIPESYAVARGLSLQVEAESHAMVTMATNSLGKPIRLFKPAAAAWSRMSDAAQRDEITLLPLSGFRSVARQAEILRHKVDAGMPLDQILTVVAAPGYSEHHTGRALDVGTQNDPPLAESFGKTEAFSWLNTHATYYGFHLSYPQNNPYGIVHEPWHWCWSPD
jgi:zinc D-Ala-D-Ala carboxypeptidase